QPMMFGMTMNQGGSSSGSGGGGGYGGGGSRGGMGGGMMGGMGGMGGMMGGMGGMGGMMGGMGSMGNSASFAGVNIAGGGMMGGMGGYGGGGMGGMGGVGGRGGAAGARGGGRNTGMSRGLEYLTTVTDTEQLATTVRDFFATAGVDLSSTNKAVFFNDRLGVLMVKATLGDLDIIERAVQVLNMAPPQVTIKAKFLEITQNDNKALGFNWYLGNTMMRGGGIGLSGGTAPSYVSPNQATLANPSGVFPGPGALPGQAGPYAIVPAVTDGNLTSGLRNSAPALGTITGILTDPQFRMVVNALEQRDGVDLLACPEVTTLSGRQTQIKVVDVRYIVTDLSINQTTSGGGNTGTGGLTIGGGGVGSTVQPIAEGIEVGPTLDVVPYVTADGYTIQMAIIPTLKEFVGYDDAGAFVAQIQSVGSSVGAPLVAPTPLPKFRLRTVATQCIVWDGQTVVLGGLIAENVTKTKDKVPMLGDMPLIGRFFRSEANNSLKKNLMIFVTPRIIDPAGNPVHSDDEMPFAKANVPEQSKQAVQ
ncbi:MAG: hypothetical protein NTW03_04170, partial [Verrucomicrobia bacterium]|nr:hypothetical protein [Verrucomicrobiota bacterium]